MRSALPPVSCMCLTYGRPGILEEAVESFLRQDYEGVKELVVLNDFEDQNLKFDHPEVKVINIAQRFNSVGEKRNACASLSSHEHLFVWDDDDIFLPNRISYTISKMTDPQENGAWADFFKPSKAFVFMNGRISYITENLFHSGGAWTRKLFDSIKGYAHIGSGEDAVFETELEKRKPGRKRNFNHVELEDMYYIYRWGDFGSYHLSALGGDEGGITSNQKVDNYMKEKAETEGLPRGDIYLSPHWKQDYVKMKEDFIRDPVFQ